MGVNKHVLNEQVRITAVLLTQTQTFKLREFMFHLETGLTQYVMLSLKTNTKIIANMN